MKVEKKQLSLKEASEVYSIPLWTIRKWVFLRAIPFRKIGRRVYLPVERLEAWLSEHDVDPKREEGMTDEP